ncbi:peptide ABC transporter substrate-binding protein [Arthrobacter sp. MYb224]|uniref:ABC transporter substrate-binding protein n=1 Tax=unclassified Arthrobacter TaxID=235627 RepID=UPI000CFC65C4|nr:MULTISPECIES: ABC transporter substrate-binding protein [unclassified Arthrobacter]PRA00309.1 peptide ABC transporter substrate-binding protein [Arthrobacter sp. MYb224]PRA04500.1 peptide ABC transporter substrate-binding protein [Arthrobacter sp. MYb229]PRB51587.1 peptide ABC transporter substrate-binding protein [Arthrobacter sp. MYb216]
MSAKKNYCRLAAAAVVGSLVLTACSAGSGGNSSEGSAENTSVTVALTGEPVNLDFTTTAGAAIPQALMSNVYEGLVEIDQAGKIQPLLAESWELSNGNKTYTFKLREGATFSNGEAFTAEDVKFSIERVQSDAWVSSLKKKMDIVDSVEVNSDTEVAITLKQPSNAWLFDMGTLVGAIFDPSGVDDLAGTAIGTGPYEIDAWNRGQSIEFATREDYWGEAPTVENVSLRYFADAVATTNALQSGDVDVVYNMQSPELLSSFESDGKYQVLDGTSNGEIVLSMNNNMAPFDDLRVRQAVMHAIDRQAVVDTAWNGYGTVVGGPVPTTDPYYEDLNDVYPYDPAKAESLLAEAGAQDLDITFTVPTRPYATAVSEIVVSQLADVGINAKIESAEFPAVWLDEVFTKQDYQMSVVLAVESRDVLAMFNNPDYYLGYDNSKIKDLAAEADAADEAGYVDGMKQVVRTIVDDAAANTLFIFPNIVVAKAEVTGIPANSVTEALDLTNLGWK